MRKLTFISLKKNFNIAKKPQIGLFALMSELKYKIGSAEHQITMIFIGSEHPISKNIIFICKIIHYQDTIFFLILVSTISL